MNGLREKMSRMMIGRYGIDELGRFTLYVSLGVMILSMLVRFQIIYLLSFLMLVVCYVRMFSRNITRRSQENQKFLQLRYKMIAKFAGWKQNMQVRKTHHIYKCPSCTQKVRVPKGKGRIEIRCPKCSTKFVKKS